MSENFKVLDEQKEALKQVELILPLLSEELVDILVVIEEQLLPAINVLKQVCPIKNSKIIDEIQGELSNSIYQIAVSSGSIDKMQRHADELRSQISGFSLISSSE